MSGVKLAEAAVVPVFQSLNAVAPGRLISTSLTKPAGAVPVAQRIVNVVDVRPVERN